MKFLMAVSAATSIIVGTLPGAVINDGTSTLGLARWANDAALVGYTTNWLEPAGDGTLEALVDSELFSFPPLQTVWYGLGLFPTGTVYTVSAEFKPAVVDFQYQGGVAGMLNLSAQSGFSFYAVPPGGVEDGVYVAFLDLAASAVSTNHLFGTNGIGVADSAFGARSTMTGGYVASAPATFELSFGAPSAADLLVLSNATAHIVAKVWQTQGASRVQVNETLELLTDLPLPPPGAHAVGYHAVWGDFGKDENNQSIGFFDNLQIDGQFTRVNVPPYVALTSPSPEATNTAPANIPLAVGASDYDGQVVRIDYYREGSQWIASSTVGPSFAATWNGALAGNYTLTAVATDNENASSTSPPVKISVSQPSTPPTLTFTVAGNSILLQWDRAGFQLESSTDLGTTWAPLDAVPTTATSHQEAMTGDRRFYRLRQ